MPMSLALPTPPSPTPAATLPADQEITDRLNAWTRGEAAFEDGLAEAVYPALRLMARGLFAAERQNHTLQPTALVHEAFFRLGSLKDVSWQNRHHFLSMSARVMRRVLVDHARSHLYQKRGGGQVAEPLTEARDLPAGLAPDVVAVHEALASLERLDPHRASIVEMHYFGGFSYGEIATALGISRSTVKRRWQLARLFLLRQLSPDMADPC